MFFSALSRALRPWRTMVWSSTRRIVIFAIRIFSCWFGFKLPAHSVQSRAKSGNGVKPPIVDLAANRYRIGEMLQGVVRKRDERPGTRAARVLTHVAVCKCSDRFRQDDGTVAQERRGQNWVFTPKLIYTIAGKF